MKKKIVQKNKSGSNKCKSSNWASRQKSKLGGSLNVFQTDFFLLSQLFFCFREKFSLFSRTGSKPSKLYSNLSEKLENSIWKTFVSLSSLFVLASNRRPCHLFRFLRKPIKDETNDNEFHIFLFGSGFSLSGGRALGKLIEFFYLKYFKQKGFFRL